MKIIVNGSPVEVTDAKQHYNDLCRLAGLDPRQKPTMTYSRAFRGASGTRKPGGFIRVCEGTIVDVAITGAA